MSDFSNPKNKLEGELEDLRLDIDRKEKDLRMLDEKSQEIERQKELLEDELEDLREQEERSKKDIDRLEANL